MQWYLPQEDLIGRRRSGLPVGDAQGGAGVALRIEIDHECLQPLHREPRGEVHGGGGLSHAALLVGHGEDPVALRSRELTGGGVQDLHRPLGRRPDRGVGVLRPWPRFT